MKSRWKYTRKSGETVIVRDLFEKFVRWIDMFKEIGDVAIQYDPAHAALPWAGIRLILQVSDSLSLKKAIDVNPDHCKRYQQIGIGHGKSYVDI
jgi:hypothetical protein